MPSLNLGQERLERLLDLYSVQKLSHHFTTKERTKDSLIRKILESSSQEDIVNFARHYHATTKHHIHLFDFPGAVADSMPDDPLDGLPYLEWSEKKSERREWFYLLLLSYNVYLREPVEMVKAEFVWPVHIACTKNSMQIRFTIMEKNMPARFPPARIIKSEKVLDERLLTKRVQQSQVFASLSPTDLNRGIKSMWNDQLIDAPSVQWKKARSTTRQVMDGDYLVRRDDIALYNDIVDKPLMAATYKWTGDKQLSIDHFSADASSGQLTFRTYSDEDTGAAYVVREILERN